MALNTRLKRQACISAGRLWMPMPPTADGVIGAADRAVSGYAYAFVFSPPDTAAFVMAQRSYQSGGKQAYRPVGKVPYKPQEA